MDTNLQNQSFLDDTEQQHSMETSTNGVGNKSEDNELSIPSSTVVSPSENQSETVERVGSYISKTFDDSGVFYGIVRGYKSPFYQIVYDDGDEEELSETEVERLTCSKDSVPAQKIEKLSNTSKKRRVLSVPSKRPPVAHPSRIQPARESPAKQEKEYVCKEFDGFGNFFGVVHRFEDPFYKVIYEDGDAEDMSRSDLEKCRCPTYNVPTASLKKLVKLTQGSSTLSSLEMGGLEKPSLQRKKRGPKSKAAMREMAKDAARAAMRGKKSVPPPPDHTLLKKKKQKPRATPQKKSVPFENREFLKKEVDGVGTLYGFVLTSTDSVYQAMFEDGGKENFEEEELEDQCSLCALSTVPDESQQLLKHLLETSSATPKKKAAALSRKRQASSKSPAVAEDDDDSGGESAKEEPVPKKPRKQRARKADKAPLCKRFIKKRFDGFGDFFGIIKDFTDPFYNVVYEDGDEEDMAPEDVTPLLVDSKSGVPKDKKKILRQWVYTYTYGPAIPPTGAAAPKVPPSAKYTDLTPRELSQVEIYRRYVGREFLDKETKEVFVVRAVCRNETYSELLFRYTKKGDSGEEDEFSGCSEMLTGAAGVPPWTEWLPASEDKVSSSPSPPPALADSASPNHSAQLLSAEGASGKEESDGDGAEREVGVESSPISPSSQAEVAEKREEDQQEVVEEDMDGDSEGNDSEEV